MDASPPHPVAGAPHVLPAIRHTRLDNVQGLAFGIVMTAFGLSMLQAAGLITGQAGMPSPKVRQKLQEVRAVVLANQKAADERKGADARARRNEFEQRRAEQLARLDELQEKRA